MRTNYELRYKNAQLRRQRMAAAIAKGTHTKDEWRRLLAAVNGRCVRCQAPSDRLCKDHIIPIYQGGSNSIRNVQPLCPRCNASKGPEAIDHRSPAILWWLA